MKNRNSFFSMKKKTFITIFTVSKKIGKNGTLIIRHRYSLNCLEVNSSVLSVEGLVSKFIKLETLNLSVSLIYTS